jgi:hypothetical protein
MLRGLREVRPAGDQARDHGAGDQAARDHDVARAAHDDAALDDAAIDDAAIDHDLRARRNAGHHLLGALHSTRVCGQHRPCGCARLELLCSVYLVLQEARIELSADSGGPGTCLPEVRRCGAANLVGYNLTQLNILDDGSIWIIALTVRGT